MAKSHSVRKIGTDLGPRHPGGGLGHGAGSDTVLNGTSFCKVMRIKGPVSVDHAIDQMC
jgi:hypothetical protein